MHTPASVSWVPWKLLRRNSVMSSSFSSRMMFRLREDWEMNRFSAALEKFRQRATSRKQRICKDVMARPS